MKRRGESQEYLHFVDAVESSLRVHEERADFSHGSVAWFIGEHPEQTENLFDRLSCSTEPLARYLAMDCLYLISLTHRSAAINAVMRGHADRAEYVRKAADRAERTISQQNATLE